MKIKRCSDCGRFLGENSFYRGKYQCKKCSSNMRWLWLLYNNEQAYIKQRQWRKRNKEFLKEYDRIHNKMYYEENKEKQLKYQKQYYKGNKEKINKRSRIYYEKNKGWLLEKSKVTSELWRKNNPDKINAKNAKRRATKRNQSPNLTHTEQQWMESIYKMCTELNKNLGQGGFQVDHVESLDKGGLHHPNNLQIIPATQNLQKSNKDPKEFYGRYYNFIIEGFSYKTLGNYLKKDK